MPPRSKAYDEETRRHALAMYEKLGGSETARRTGISRDTLNEWAKAEGIDRDAVNERIINRTRRAAAVSGARRLKAHEEAREKISSELHTVAQLLVLRCRQVLQRNEFGPDQLQGLSTLLRESVRTMELLGGRPTARVAVEHEINEMLQGVAVAFQAILPMIVEAAGEEAADRVRLEFAQQLRLAKEQVEQGFTADVLELEAGEVEEAA